MCIYAFTLARGLVCIIYTSDTLCLPKERFISTNNRSISRDCYRETKFSAKTTFVLFTGDTPQYLVLQLTTNICSIQSLLSFAVKAEI